MLKNIDYPLKYSRICNQTHDGTQIREFCSIICISDLGIPMPDAGCEHQCFYTRKAMTFNTKPNALTCQTVPSRRPKAMLLDGQTRKTTRKQPRDSEYFSRMRI